MNIIQSSNDFDTSFKKAMDEIDPRWHSYDGLIVLGSHSPTFVDEKIAALKNAREKGIPTLGICFGLQLMAIEYAKNVKNIELATSEEISKEGVFVVKKMSGFRVGLIPVLDRFESHWHQYKVDEKVAFDDNWRLVKTDDVVEIALLKTHPYYIGVQWHPEYQSSRSDPHPLLKEFIEVCKKK